MPDKEEGELEEGEIAQEVLVYVLVRIRSVVAEREHYICLCE